MQGWVCPLLLQGWVWLHSMAPSNRGSDEARDFEMVHTAVTDILNSACSGGTELSWRHYCVMVTVIITHAESKYSPASKFFCSKSSTGVDEYCHQLHLWVSGGYNDLNGAEFGLPHAVWRGADRGGHWSFHVEPVVLVHISYFTGFYVFILISCSGKASKGCTSEMRIGECQSCKDSVDGDSVFWPQFVRGRQGQVSSCICRYVSKSLLPL